MIKPIMLLLIGLPGSGKSVYAKHIEESRDYDASFAIWKRINWDDLRKEMPGYVSGQRFNSKREEEMVKRSHEIARGYAAAGYSLVIDNTNLNPKTRNDWARLAEELGMELRIKTMPATLKECQERDSQREDTARVGRAVIDRMALTYGLAEFPRNFVIVDMDGTLSDSSERQKYLKIEVPCPGERDRAKPCDYGFYRVRNSCDTFTFTELCRECEGTGKKTKKDWGAFFRHVGEDKTNPFVEQLVHDFAVAGYDIVIVSGRPMDQCGAVTEKWLYDHNIPYRYLFMRRSGDNRDDTIIKKEILDKLPKDKIFCAIDDRPRIIRMWKENGLNVIDVGTGVEF